MTSSPAMIASPAAVPSPVGHGLDSADGVPGLTGSRGAVTLPLGPARLGQAPPAEASGHRVTRSRRPSRHPPHYLPWGPALGTPHYLP